MDGIIENEQKNTRDTIEKLKQILSINQYLEMNQLLRQTIASLLLENQAARFQDDATLIAVTIN